MLAEFEPFRTVLTERKCSNSAKHGIPAPTYIMIIPKRQREQFDKRDSRLSNTVKG
jgi:hypothetical protein